MAENESLDVGNRRFQWVVSDLLRGLPAEAIAHRLLKKLCGAWAYVRRHGLDVFQVINLAIAGQDLAPAVRGTGGSDFAHLIKLHASGPVLPATVLDKVNRAAIEMVVESGIQRVISHRDGPSLLAAIRMKREIVAAAEPALSSLSDSLLRGPKTPLRVRVPNSAAAPTPVPVVTIPLPAGLLQQSLLPTTRRAAQGIQA
jgi:hypothetical protein